ncbi:MAG: SMC-Scp complex subunit ScpB, partial [Planctomycetota bacterium]
MSTAPEENPESSEEQGVSLDELAKAYAESLADPATPAAQPQQPAEAPSARPAGEGDVPSAEDASPDPTGELDHDDPCPLTPTTILEAMLFVGNRENEPLTSSRAAELMRGVEPGEIPALVDELNRRYASSGCPYRVVSQGAGYQLVLDKAFDSVRGRFYGRVREARLSQAALDVLAIVAYRQPIVGDEVSRLRGHPSGHLLMQMVRRRLLKIERPAGRRRPLSYRTTDRFLELFGL